MRRSGPGSHTVQASALPVYGFRANAAPHPEINMVILKLICKRKGPKTAGTVLKRDEVGELTCLDFKAYYKGTAARHRVDVDGGMALGAQRYAPHLPPTDFRKARS